MESNDEKEKNDFMILSAMWLKEQALSIEENVLNIQYISRMIENLKSQKDVIAEQNDFRLNKAIQFIKDNEELNNLQESEFFKKYIKEVELHEEKRN